MEKRYQVFISSTYADLKEERQKVIQALMEMDCFPASMEIFPSIDDEQWEFIKKIISDCDYYILIIGGRYGSLTPDGISYTEKEFDYAVSLGIKVIVFIHEKPEEIPAKKSELNPLLREKLDAFRTRVSQDRLVRFWNNAAELPGLVALSLQKTIKTYPAVGWVRANLIANADLLNDLNDLRKQNQELVKRIHQFEIQNEPMVNNLAGLEQKVKITGNCYESSIHSKSNWKSWELEISWGELFALIAPFLLEHPSDSRVKTYLATTLASRFVRNPDSTTIEEQIYQTIKIQLVAVRLVEINFSEGTSGHMALFWTLTKEGYSQMLLMRTIKIE